MRIANYSDRSKNVEVSFQVGEDDASTWAILRPTLDQLTSSKFELGLTTGPLSEGSASVSVAGHLLGDGVIAVELEPEGRLSGALQGAKATSDSPVSTSFSARCRHPESRARAKRALLPYRMMAMRGKY